MSNFICNKNQKKKEIENTIENKSSFNNANDQNG